MAATSGARGPRIREVNIPAGPVQLGGTLSIPAITRGVVAFAHGSGSGRFSPRNQYVARTLQQAGMATLLFDLLTEDEAQNRSLVFDIPLLAQRLRAATNWLRADGTVGSLPFGYFGASTGAGAALLAAAEEGKQISAVVSRGGRPDLANGALPLVTAPTLMIVGGLDTQVIRLNESAYSLMRAPREIVIVPGATHLFEEPGALEDVARVATLWFERYLKRRAVA